MLAPMIMLMACLKVMRFADTKPMTITVTAPLLCKTAVARAPAKTPIKTFLVRRAGCFLQAFTHEIHPVNEQSQSAEQLQYSL